MEDLKNFRILIMGGSGVLAQQLADTFLDSGYEVTLCTRRVSSVGSFADSRLLRVLHTDWSNQSLDMVCEGIDCVINCAGLGATECELDFELAGEVNAANPLRLLKASSFKGVRSFVHLSSFHVYGRDTGIINEFSPTNPVAAYGRSKLEGERKLKAFAQEHLGLPAVLVLRLSNVVVPPRNSEAESWKLAVNDICRQAYCNRLICIRGPSNTRRDFMSANSFSTAMLSVVNHEISRQKPELPDFKVFNLGSGTSYSLAQICEMVSERMASMMDETIHVKYGVKDNFDGDLKYCVENFKQVYGLRETDLSGAITEILDTLSRNEDFRLVQNKNGE